MAVYGYNTDVPTASDTYHVQTELRSGERVIESQVFIKGRTVAKHRSSVESDLADTELQELLRAQHKFIVEGVRADQRLRPGGHRDRPKK